MSPDVTVPTELHEMLCALARAHRVVNVDSLTPLLHQPTSRQALQALQYGADDVPAVRAVDPRTGRLDGEGTVVIDLEDFVVAVTPEGGIYVPRHWFENRHIRGPRLPAEADGSLVALIEGLPRVPITTAPPADATTLARIRDGAIIRPVGVADPQVEHECLPGPDAARVYNGRSEIQREAVLRAGVVVVDLAKDLIEAIDGWVFQGAAPEGGLLIAVPVRVNTLGEIVKATNRRER